jgi:hypothetical protein
MPLGIRAEALGAGRHEEVRHFVVVQILPGGGVRVVGERANHSEDPFSLHQLADSLQPEGWVVLVVLHPVDDLAAADASLGLVDVLEVAFVALGIME